MAPERAKTRLDQWLWFARLAKSRSLAARLCAAGAVAVNGATVTKPNQTVRVGDFVVMYSDGVSESRNPAGEELGSDGLMSAVRRFEPRSAIPANRIETNGISLDPGAREVHCHGKRVELTTFEFDILEMLMRSAGRVLSRDTLMESFYNRKATPFDRSIDMHISHLRKKVENGDALIKTIRGVGYQFCRTPEDAAE